MLQELDLKRLRIPADLAKTLILIAAYGAWILVFRLLCLSFLVYFLTRAGHTISFEEINDSFGNNEIVFLGFGSALFYALIRGFSPLFDREGFLAISWKDVKTQYLTGFLQGALLAGSIILGFLLLGNFRYVGFFVQIEDTGLAILGILFRILALLALGFAEEFIFRHRRTSEDKSGLPVSVLVLAGLYCAVKMAQFDLSWLHLVTLALLSCYLSVRRLRERSFLSGAGFWSAVLIVIHPLFSLPIFGSDFSGIFLLKYTAQTAVPAAISGGAGGPLSSVAFQAILLIEIVRGWIAYKKSLSNASPDFVK